MGVGGASLGPDPYAPLQVHMLCGLVPCPCWCRACLSAITQGDGSSTCPSGIHTLPLQQPETLRLRSRISSYRQHNSYVYTLVNMNYWHRLFGKSSQTEAGIWAFFLFATRGNRDIILDLQTPFWAMIQTDQCCMYTDTKLCSNYMLHVVNNGRKKQFIKVIGEAKH